jgi:hypothetical protein
MGRTQEYKNEFHIHNVQKRIIIKYLQNFNSSIHIRIIIMPTRNASPWYKISSNIFAKNLPNSLEL